MPEKHEHTTAGADGLEQLLQRFGLRAMRFPPEITGFEQKVAYLNERTELIFSPITLEGSWYQTAAAPILARSRDGAACAIFPDWRGRICFVEGGERRRTVVTARNCGYFYRDAYTVSTALPGRKVTTAGLLRRLLSGVSPFEGCLLLLWSLLGGGLTALLGLLMRRIVSSVAMAADAAGFAEPTLLLAGGLLLGLLLLYSGRRLIRRVAQKGALALLPALGERLYFAPGPAEPAASARRLAGLRGGGEDIACWLLRLLCALVIGLTSSLCLAAVSVPALVVSLGMLGGLALSSFAVFALFALRPAPQKRDDEQYEWLTCCARDRRFGVRRRFPFGLRTGGAAGAGLLLLSAPFILLPPLVLSLVQQDSLAQFLQTLILMLPATALPLYALLRAPLAGRALADMRALLPDAAGKPDGDVDLPPMGSALELKNVTFFYPGRSRPVVRDVSLRLAPGETVGILGGTGAGKTTLARLMAGVLAPSSGSVYYGGVELSRFNPESLLRRIALENGQDVLLLERWDGGGDARTRVVFSCRESELKQCGKIYKLSEGTLSRLEQEAVRS